MLYHEDHHCPSQKVTLDNVSLTFSVAFTFLTFSVAFTVTGHFHLNHFFLEFKIIHPLAPATFSFRAFPPHYSFDFWNTIALFIAAT